MGLKETLGDNFVAGSKVVTLDVGGGKSADFTVAQLGWLEIQSVYATAKRTNQSALVLLVQAAVSKDGDKFTIDEVSRMKQEPAQALLNAVIEINNLGDEEKN